MIGDESRTIDLTKDHYDFLEWLTDQIRNNNIDDDMVHIGSGDGNTVIWRKMRVYTILSHIKTKQRYSGLDRKFLNEFKRKYIDDYETYKARKYIEAYENYKKRKSKN